MKLRARGRKIAGFFVLMAFGLWMLPPRAAAAESAKAAKKTTRTQTAKKTTQHRKSSRHYARRRRSSYRYRLSRLRLQPDRVQEIQQALIREGYLKQEANGKWDDATRDAMRNYQQANGFEVTGLPEAKTLMKLGLGPHPLPADADPSLVGRASTTPPAGNSVAPSASPDPR
jgi:peptidoglycan hydrolase-like protein with peptidoglycan-binding domain